MYEFLLVICQGTYFLHQLKLRIDNDNVLFNNGIEPIRTLNPLWTILPEMPKTMMVAKRTTPPPEWFELMVGSLDPSVRAMLPERLTPEEYYDLPSNLKEFYCANERDQIVTWEPTPFEIVKTVTLKHSSVELTEMFSNAYEYKANFPYNIKEIPNFHFLCEGYIPASAVFAELCKVVKNLYRNHKSANFGLVDYENIGGITLSRSVTLATPYMFDVDVSKWGSKKKKIEKRTKTARDVELVTIATAEYAQKYGSAKKNCFVCKAIHGKDYFEAAKNLQELIEQVKKLFDADNVKECPHCKGLGVVIELPIF